MQGKAKPQFGREMDPCEYESKWANKLPSNEIVVIKAMDNKAMDNKKIVKKEVNRKMPGDEVR